MLTDQEINLVRRVFAQGPGILLDESYTIETAQAFLAKPDVQLHLSLLSKEMSVADVTGSRLKFLARRHLAALVNPAVATLARALLGPTYQRDKDGVIERDTKGNYRVTDPGPTSVQVSASSEVLDRLNVVPDAKTALILDGGDMVMRLLPAVSKAQTKLENPQLGATEEERALARERIRTTVMRLLPSVQAIKKEVDAKLAVVPAKSVIAKAPKPKKKLNANPPPKSATK